MANRYENKRILINSQLKVLFNLPSVSNESGAAIKTIQRTINNCISWDSIFTYLCSSKLPEATLSLWEQSLKNKSESPKWKDLDDFLTARFQTLEAVLDIKGAHSSSSDTRKFHAQNAPANKKLNTFNNNVSQQKCKLCQESHNLRVCPKFIQMNVQDRFSAVKKLHICLNCLASSHMVHACRSHFVCFKCKGKHHTLLHREFDSSAQQPTSNSRPPQAPQRVSYSTQIQSHFVSHSKSVLLGTALVHICHLGIMYTARALIDSGSEGTFISERLQKILKLSTQPIQAQISGLNDAISARSNRVCSFILGSPINSQIQMEVSALILPKLTNLPSVSLEPTLNKQLYNIRLADPNFEKSAQIDLLIGGDLYPTIVLDGIKRNVLSSLIAQETILMTFLRLPKL